MLPTASVLGTLSGNLVPQKGSVYALWSAFPNQQFVLGPMHSGSATSSPLRLCCLYRTMIVHNTDLNSIC